MFLLSIDALIAKVETYHPDGSQEVIRKAYEFGRKAHLGQHRASGEDYIEHPLAVAQILADLELDTETIAAALLHDVVEDTSVSLDQIKASFGQEIAALVDGVTKLNRLEFVNREEEQVENLRKMFLAMAKDIRVVMVKLADRLHNMRTLRHLPPARQKEIARETLEIFAPLAHRLGIYRIKWELEDLSLRFLEPGKYVELTELVTKRRHERESYISMVMGVLREKLEENGIKADIQGRAKHFYSIYKKMYEQQKDFSEIYDLVAIRVIVDSVRDCYAVLGIVHTLWKPIPGRFKDYIAMPKSNMYQSLHTTVIGPEGEPFEIQIRTWEMHRTAEFGIAAHWKYKEGRTDRSFDEKLAWLRSIQEWQHDLRDAREFMESLKIDLFADQVFVFTPKGDVVDLPAGAGPLDFAYQIHTDVGHHCVGAKVNGRIVPLDYRLKNGDIVEILTSKQASGPSHDWLNIVVTSGAKSKIRSWFRKERREENLALGRETIEREIRRRGYEPHELLREPWLEELSKRFNLQSAEDIYVAIGYGGLSANNIIGKLEEQYRKEKKAEKPPAEDFFLDDSRKKKPAGGVKVKGIDNVLVRFARCCNPVPGDDIVGYITRGRGVSIHRDDCVNVSGANRDNERIIEVDWAQVRPESYPVEIIIDALDRPGLLSDVARILADIKTNILSAKAKTRRDRTATINVVVEIKNLEQLDFIMKRISRVRDVLHVDRASNHGGRGH